MAGHLPVDGERVGLDDGPCLVRPGQLVGRPDGRHVGERPEEHDRNEEDRPGGGEAAEEGHGTRVPGRGRRGHFPADRRGRSPAAAATPGRAAAGRRPGAAGDAQVLDHPHLGRLYIRSARGRFGNVGGDRYTCRRIDPHGFHDERNVHGIGRQEREGEGDRARRLGHREAVRQGRHHAPRQSTSRGEASRRHPHRLPSPRPRPRRGRLPAGPHRRDLRPGVVRQDHPHPARHRRGPEARRRGGLHRRRARPRPRLRPQAGRATSTTCWSPSPTPASRPSRSPRRWSRSRRGRRRRRRLGGGAGAQGRDRGRDGRQPRGPAGPADEPGAAQAHRRRSTSRNTVA